MLMIIAGNNCPTVSLVSRALQESGLNEVGILDRGLV